MSEHPEIAEHEWFETEWGEFRVEQKRFGTWTSLSQEWRALITGLTREVVIQGTKFHLEESLLTGQTAEHPKHLMESLEVNYETD